MWFQPSYMCSATAVSTTDEPVSFGAEALRDSSVTCSQPQQLRFDALPTVGEETRLRGTLSSDWLPLSAVYRGADDRPL